MRDALRQANHDLVGYPLCEIIDICLWVAGNGKRRRNPSVIAVGAVTLVQPLNVGRCRALLCAHGCPKVFTR